MGPDRRDTLPAIAGWQVIRRCYENASRQAAQDGCFVGFDCVDTQRACSDSPKAFAFVGPQYVITAEVSSPRSFVVNFINLSDFVIVIQPNEFIYRGASKRYYIGQVFEQERKDTRGDTLKYSASFLLKGRSFTGLTILGAFREQEQIKELSVRISICCSTPSNTCRSRCRTRCGCTATCTRARSSSCCWACGRRPALPAWSSAAC